MMMMLERVSAISHGEYILINVGHIDVAGWWEEKLLTIKYLLLKFCLVKPTFYYICFVGNLF